MADFGLRVGIDGEREFKQILNEINQSFKVLGSEMQLVASQFDIAFPFNIDTFFTIIEPKFSISPTTSPTKKC